MKHQTNKKELRSYRFFYNAGTKIGILCVRVYQNKKKQICYRSFAEKMKYKYPQELPVEEKETKCKAHQTMHGLLFSRINSKSTSFL
jgi:hypothetical protein